MTNYDVKNLAPKVFCNNFVITKSNFSKSMHVSVIRIGNSRGIRLSKTILERYNIGDHVDLILDNDQIIIRPLDSPRAGWEESFRRMAEQKDDELMIDDIFYDEEDIVE